MQVRDLIEILLNMPQSDEVYVNASRDANTDHILLSVVSNPFARRVILLDHRVTREERSVTLGGVEYDVPFKIK